MSTITREPSDHLVETHRREALDAARAYLMRQDRKTGRFLYPAEREPDCISYGPSLTAAERQEQAVAEFLKSAVNICDAPPPALPSRKYEPLMADMAKTAALLRALAQNLDQGNRWQDRRSDDLKRAAHVVEEMIDRPSKLGVLFIGRDRGDLRDKAAAVHIVVTAIDLFGQQLHGVVANLMTAFLERDISREQVRDWCDLR